ncbi:MAG: GIY-YIG nuclease family protein [Arenibacter algicola]|nr:GIY-YIG nuclease family protein [Arenibacter algicola]
MKSDMRLIKSALEYRPLPEYKAVPKGLRGIYVLYKKQGTYYNVVYIGMSAKEERGRIRHRLYSHSRRKALQCTHFSYYEVWDNISDTEIRELEGVFRQIYRFDKRANALNKQVTHRPLTRVRKKTEKELGLTTISRSSLGI